ncbi:hypothetical protein FAM09_13490 [Niastella caeni]|uniref:Uncharacterized protein n=1 Tax=Niastella caeni TaxID=2569763 RepID=A0A4S8I1E9_9BACT|nr:hypothetical protein [Niastella caeni]THU39512.1 hypothetical protein FAM09_13490 [Niastella caeni]
MKNIIRSILLFLLLQGGYAYGQDSLQVTMQMGNDTIRDYKDVFLTVTIQSNYSREVMIPSLCYGAIMDTVRYVFYHLQRKNGREYEDVAPYRGCHVTVPYWEEKPEALPGFQQKVIQNHLFGYHIWKGKYRMRVICAYTINNVRKEVNSAYTYFYCSRHFRM